MRLREPLTSRPPGQGPWRTGSVRQHRSPSRECAGPGGGGPPVVFHNAFNRWSCATVSARRIRAKVSGAGRVFGAANGGLWRLGAVIGHRPPPAGTGTAWRRTARVEAGKSYAGRVAAGIATIVTALIGAVAGFLVPTYQAKQQAKQSAERADAERKAQLQTLAMEMVKVELDRAHAQGEPSRFPAAHFAVISDLLQRYGVPTQELNLPRRWTEFRPSTAIYAVR